MKNYRPDYNSDSPIRWGNCKTSHIDYCCKKQPCKSDDKEKPDCDKDHNHSHGNQNQSQEDIISNQDQTQTQGDQTQNQTQGDETQGDLSAVQGDQSQTQGGLTESQGDQTESQGDQTEILGDQTQTQGDLSETQGDLSAVQGDLTQEQGDQAASIGDQSAVQGDQTQDQTQMQGDQTESQGDQAQTQGDLSETLGDLSAVQGDQAQNQTQGDQAQTQGDLSETLGDLSAVQGDQTQTQGDASEVQGDLSQNQGDASEVQGDLTETLGDQTQTQGDETQGDQTQGDQTQTQNQGELTQDQDQTQGDQIQHMTGHGGQSLGDQILTSSPSISTPVNVSGVNFNVTLSCNGKDDCHKHNCRNDCSCRKEIADLLRTIIALQHTVTDEEAAMITFSYGAVSQTPVTGRLTSLNKDCTFAVTPVSGSHPLYIDTETLEGLTVSSTEDETNLLDQLLAYLKIPVVPEQEACREACECCTDTTAAALEDFRIARSNVRISTVNAAFTGYIYRIRNGTVYLVDDLEEPTVIYAVPLCKIVSFEEYEEEVTVDE